MKYKRSRYKRITVTSKTLRYMRMSKNISMREAGRRVNLSDSTISHIEQGRMNASEDRVKQLVEGYGYTLDEFLEYQNGKPIPAANIKDDCFSLLDQIDETKLRAVHGVLLSFVSSG